MGSDFKRKKEEEEKNQRTLLTRIIEVNEPFDISVRLLRKRKKNIYIKKKLYIYTQSFYGSTVPALSGLSGTEDSGSQSAARSKKRQKLQSQVWLQSKEEAAAESPQFPHFTRSFSLNVLDCRWLEDRRKIFELFFPLNGCWNCFLMCAP